MNVFGLVIKMENKGQLLYTSSAYEKYKKYDKKPWLLIEDMLRIKLSWKQKLHVLILHKYEKIKDYYCCPYRKYLR